jgi:hypothetical protein
LRRINNKEGKKIINTLIKENKVSLEELNFSIENDERICVNCGCSDLRACQNGCYWIEEDETSIFGICSNCEESLENFKELL